MTVDDDLFKLQMWFGLMGGGGRLIEADSLPNDVDFDSIDWDGRKSPLSRLLKNVRFPRDRSFSLGSVTTGRFGMQSSARHRIVRGKGGKIWKMYVSGPDFPDGEEFMGELKSDELLTEAEYLGYRVTLRQWISMGWRPCDEN